jgi:hypothetical protein
VAKVEDVFGSSTDAGVIEVQTFFNGAIVAHALGTADELGLLDALADSGEVASPPYGSARGALEALEYGGVVERVADRWLPGANFDAAVSYKGFFTWLFSASGATLAASGSARPATRDGRLVARAAADFGRRHLDPSLLALPEWENVEGLLEFGCGNGSRLVSLVEATGAHGIGIDTSREAIADAHAIVREAGLSARISLHVADARRLEACRIERSRVDTIFLALMGHDLWPEEQCLHTLRRWREMFPRCRQLIMCETVRRDACDDGELRIPTLGYEYLHAVLGQYIASREEWLGVFSRGGWPCKRTVAVNVPALTEIFICEPEPGPA